MHKEEMKVMRGKRDDAVRTIKLVFPFIFWYFFHLELIVSPLAFVRLTFIFVCLFTIETLIIFWNIKGKNEIFLKKSAGLNRLSRDEAWIITRKLL